MKADCGCWCCVAIVQIAIAKEIELSKQDVKTITALGRKNAVRYNVPCLYSPQWGIDLFDTPEEKDASVKVW